MALLQTEKRAVELACGNLFKVFGNYDAVSHREAFKPFYHEDVIVYEPYGVIIKGHDAIDKRVQEILEQNVDWEFKTVGPVEIQSHLRSNFLLVSRIRVTIVASCILGP
ncbi:hypothetical protein EAF00_003096 [Botryotinia globosa]|nr:hypothetical protein EAF00_003096 [Botryotinia globosa]